MELSVLQELKDYEDRQRAQLEESKRRLLELFFKRKMKLIENNKKEISALLAKKEDILEGEREKARQDALKEIRHIREKMQNLDHIPHDKFEEAAGIIFSEFLSQNV